MKIIPIHITLPQSFFDTLTVTPFEFASSLSVAYNDKQVSFHIDVVPDDYFHQFNG